MKGRINFGTGTDSPLSNVTPWTRNSRLRCGEHCRRRYHWGTSNFPFVGGGCVWTSFRDWVPIQHFPGNRLLFDFSFLKTLVDERDLVVSFLFSSTKESSYHTRLMNTTEVQKIPQSNNRIP